MTRSLLCLLIGLVCFAQDRPDRVVLITADGLRWQELFSGMDSTLMNQKAAGTDKAGGLQKQFSADTPERRRELLMPYFWSTLAPRGVVFGNVSKGSSVQVTNKYRVSYPGYSEILTGRAQDEAIPGNEKVQQPSQTILEFLREKWKLPQSGVALFGSWDHFPLIGESKRGSIYINAGYMTADGSDRMRELSALQFRVRTPWDSVRHDYITLEMALEYMKRNSPRAIHIALGETDDWAHNRRYDRVLETVQDFDGFVRQVVEFIASTAGYRGRTLLVITGDHGRGSTLEDWHGHGTKVAGAEQIWAYFSGPGVPSRGETSKTAPAFQRDIAPTILDLLGIDYREYKGVLGTPIRLR